MKVIFALLCDQELADATYREIARAAQVGFGTIGPMIKDLENVVTSCSGEEKTLVNTRELMEAWVTAIPTLSGQNFSGTVIRLTLIGCRL